MKVMIFGKSVLLGEVLMRKWNEYKVIALVFTDRRAQRAADAPIG